MKRIIETTTTTEPMEDLLGESVTIFCFNYIYTGKLTGVNSTYVELSDAAIVYETGCLTTKDWKDAQRLPRKWCVMKSAIESWGLLDKRL